MKHFVIVVDDSKNPVEINYSGNMQVGEAVLFLYNLSVQEASKRARENIIALLPENLKKDIRSKMGE